MAHFRAILAQIAVSGRFERQASLAIAELLPEVRIKVFPLDADDRLTIFREGYNALLREAIKREGITEFTPEEIISAVEYENTETAEIALEYLQINGNIVCYLLAPPERAPGVFSVNLGERYGPLWETTSPFVISTLSDATLEWIERVLDVEKAAKEAECWKICTTVGQVMDSLFDPGLDPGNSSDLPDWLIRNLGFCLTSDVVVSLQPVTVLWLLNRGAIDPDGAVRDAAERFASDVVLEASGSIYEWLGDVLADGVVGVLKDLPKFPVLIDGVYKSSFDTSPQDTRNTLRILADASTFPRDKVAKMVVEKMNEKMNGELGGNIVEAVEKAVFSPKVTVRIAAPYVQQF